MSDEDESDNPLMVVSTNSPAVRLRDLASLQERLAAVGIDIGAVVGAGVVGNIAAWMLGSGIIGGLVGWTIPLALAAYQIAALSTDGQTIGKKAMGIRIVNATDGSNPGFVKSVVVRSWVTSLLSITGIFPLLNIAPIFGTTRRCLHDYLAGTLVVKEEAAKRAVAQLPPGQTEVDVIVDAMKEQQSVSRDQLVEAMVQLKKARSKLDDLVTRASGLKNDAGQAVQRGNDDLAKKTLALHRQMQDQVATQQKHVEELDRAVSMMKANLDAGSQKIATANAMKGALKGKMASMQSTSAARKFDETFSKIEEGIGDDADRLEVEVELARAKAEASGPPPPDPVSDIDAELEKLKKELGK